MLTRFLIICLFLFFFSGCQTGMIPCPKVKADKVKRNHINKKPKYAERNVMASAEMPPEKKKSNYVRIPENHPPLEHVNVEKWDCPKPGSKKVPKALRDNIKKNKKAYESYYKNRTGTADSVHLHSSGR